MTTEAVPGLPPGWDKAEKEQRIAKMRQEAGLPPLPAEPEATSPVAMGTANGMSHDMGGMSHDMSGMSHDVGPCSTTARADMT